MSPSSSTSRTDSEIRKSLEALSRDVLLLVKSARLYPGGHPSVARVTDQLETWSLPGAPRAARLGVTRTELVLDGRFYGGRRSRISDLAEYLNHRKVRTLTVRPGAPGVQFHMLAVLLADRNIPGGRPLADALRANGIHALEIEPLEITRVHEALGTSRGKGKDETLRGQQVWLWLQAENASPEDVARALSSDELWAGALDSDSEALKFAYLVSGLGQRLDQGLELMGPDQKERILARLCAIGEKITPTELSELLAYCHDPVLLQQEGMLALMGDLEGERLIDLMAGIVAADSGRHERLTVICRHITSARECESALNAVRKHIRDGDHRGFAVEVWKNLETLLLNIYDETFVSDEYSDSLRRMGKTAKGRFEAEMDFSEDAEVHLDLIFLSLALAGGGILQEPWDALFHRIGARASNGDFPSVLTLAEAVEETAPYALSSREGLVRGFVGSALNRARNLDAGARRRLAKFAARHENLLFEPLLRGLKEARRISMRRLIVEVLAAFGPDTTPPLISKARAGPWYVTRNLVIVLGLRRDRSALPFLEAMLDHEHERVRREALRALSRFADRGGDAVRSFAEDPERDEGERRLAASLLERTRTA